MLITSRANCRYLCGFTGSNGYLLVTHETLLLFTDSRYLLQAERECLDTNVVLLSQGHRSLADSLMGCGAKELVFEFHDISHKTYTDIMSVLDGLVSLIPENYVIEKLRSVKQSEEIKHIEKAVEIADEAMSTVGNLLKSGMTELDVANKLERLMQDLGSESLAFDIIVGVGENSAMPHHSPSDRVITNGDMVVIDMGAVYMGYRSDLTRTFQVGELTEKFKEIYSLVLKSQLAVEERVQYGMKGSEVDAIARNVISERGYGDFFSHGLGHGVGLEVHEKPMLTKNSDECVEIGSVFTVEPGIYLPGWGGVRLEDMMVMESKSARLLTNSSKYDF